MWTKLVSLLLVLTLMAAPVAMAASTGDPLDTNDRTMGTVEDDCALAQQYPACQWCWTQCMFAVMEAMWFDGDWDWGVH